MQYSCSNRLQNVSKVQLAVAPACGATSHMRQSFKRMRQTHGLGCKSELNPQAYGCKSVLNPSPRQRVHLSAINFESSTSVVTEQASRDRTPDDAKNYIAALASLVGTWKNVSGDRKLRQQLVVSVQVGTVFVPCCMFQHRVSLDCLV
jgi:hypothetical protein